MRILIVSPTLPYPPTSGFPTRVYQFLRLLSRRHSVSLLSYAEAGETEQIAVLKSTCAAVHTVLRSRRSGSSKRRAQLCSLLTPVSFARRNLYSAEMQRKLNDLNALEPYDVVQVESSQLAGFHCDPRSALVLDEHDIVYELLHRMYLTERSMVRRLYNLIEFSKFRRAEIKSWRSVSGCVTTSSREERIIRRAASDTPTLVAPNAVDIDYFRPSDATVDEHAIVMTGFMKTRPNLDGALYFIREILPRIVAVRPKTVFYVVGAGAPEALQQLAGPSVVVTGAVPDVRPYVDRAAVFVVPLRMGGGTRLKVLEGLSMKKPMVSTSLGCEGIDVRHREHLVVADQPAAFAAAVLELLDDRAVAARLGDRGRDLVERQYQWEMVAGQLETFYTRLLESRRSRDTSRRAE
jgi:glycosyltransferase involved in cell wall biosynthesis